MSRIIKYVSIGDPFVLGSDPSPDDMECSSDMDNADGCDGAAEPEEEKLTLAELEKMRSDMEAQHNSLMMQARQEAEAISEQARRDAEEFLQHAQQEIEQRKAAEYQNAKQQGYQDGVNQGRSAIEEEMRQSVSDAAAKAQRIIDSAQEEARRIVLDAEPHIVNIIQTALRKILAREVSDNPMMVLPIVKSALEKVQHQSQIQIKVNPEDYDLILLARRDLQLIVGLDQVLAFSADETIDAGGCIIETASGFVDARLDTQMDMVTKALQAVAS